MAVPSGPMVLHEAVVLKRLCIGGHTEEKIEDYLDEDGNEIRTTITVPDYAEPGDIIDVSEWANVDAYVRQGSIQLLPPDYELRQRAIAASPAASKTRTSKRRVEGESQ